MGSVIDFIECPKCKQKECLFDFYYRTGEEYITCNDCGYFRTFHWKRNEGELIKKDINKGFEFDNLISEEIEISNPYGAYRIEFNGGMAECGTLEDENVYQLFVSDIVSLTNQPNEINKVIFSRLVGDSIEKVIIYENK